MERSQSTRQKPCQMAKLCEGPVFPWGKTWKEVKVLARNCVRWRNFVRALCSLEEKHGKKSKYSPETVSDGETLWGSYVPLRKNMERSESTHQKPCQMAKLCEGPVFPWGMMGNYIYIYTHTYTYIHLFLRTLLECIDYNPWQWSFKGWYILQLCIVLIRYLFTNIWVYLLVFISCSDILHI